MSRPQLEEKLRLGSTPSSVVDDAVVVVVAEVLAPQAVAGRERVLVAVRVVDADEPQLARVDERRDLEARARRLAVVVDEVVQRAPAGLAGEPLAGVLHRVVEDGGAARDVCAGRALGDLQRDDLATAVGRAGDALGDECRVVGDQAVVLLGVLLLVVGRSTASYFVQTSNAASVAPAVASLWALREVLRAAPRVLFVSLRASTLAAPIWAAVPTTSIVPRLRLRPSVRSKPCVASAARFFGGGLDAVAVEAGCGLRRSGEGGERQDRDERCGTCERRTHPCETPLATDETFRSLPNMDPHHPCAVNLDAPRARELRYCAGGPSTGIQQTTPSSSLVIGTARSGALTPRRPKSATTLTISQPLRPA